MLDSCKLNCKYPQICMSDLSLDELDLFDVCMIDL